MLPRASSETSGKNKSWLPGLNELNGPQSSSPESFIT